MDMKQSLYNLYSSHQRTFESIVAQFPGQDVAGPLLLSPSEKYQQQARKLLIVGQETKGWGYYADNIEAGMRHYEEFNVGQGYYSSPFWNVTRKVERLLRNQEYSCAWTNISKFDVEHKRASGEQLAAISEIDSLLIKEIEIIQPDIVLFYTGPDFDSRIVKLFPGIRMEQVPGFDLRQVARLRHKLLPGMAIRSCHPNSLRLRKLEPGFLEYVSSLL
jgi:hypothetical protein